MRQRRIVGALGAEGQGKTAWASQIIDAYPAEAGDVRALDPAHNWSWGEWPGGSGKSLASWLGEVVGQKPGEWTDIPDAPRHRGLLVLDDLDRYASCSSSVRDGFRQIFIANRHYHLDIIWSAHRAADVPKQLIGCCQTLILFQQTEVRAVEYLEKLIHAEPGSLKKMARLEPGQALRVELRGGHAGIPKPIRIF